MKKFRIIIVFWLVLTMVVPQLSYGQAPDRFTGHISPQTTEVLSPSCAQPIPGYPYFWDDPFSPTPQCISAVPYMAAGYTCLYQTKTSGGGWDYYQTTCTIANPVTYSGNILSPYSIQGLASGGGTSRIVPWSLAVFDKPSPFLYLKNAPEGPVTISLDSVHDKFSPLPAFNSENTWKAEVKNGDIYVDGTQTDHLFYELALNKLTLNRHGRNFSSKEELISYLNTSDFFTNMQFNEEETQNSRDYIINELKEAKDQPNYYLTVLDKEAIEEVSTLNIEPAPTNITRNFFAVYPSYGPVATEGDFIFPAEREATTDFEVMETGELLVNSNMFVFFK